MILLSHYQKAKPRANKSHEASRVCEKKQLTFLSRFLCLEPGGKEDMKKALRFFNSTKCAEMENENDKYQKKNFETVKKSL